VNSSGTREHWEQVYATKSAGQVSWFRPHLETSLTLIECAAPLLDAAIIDVGGGASTLVDDLLARGYTDLTVLDISESALEAAKRRLGESSQIIRWIHADITQADLTQVYDIWHDRAVFHFLTQPQQKLAYVTKVASALKPGGHAIISTFGPEGPTRCSGLDVMRYDAGTLQAAFGERFRLIESAKELHRTPFGTTQQFLCCHFVLEL